ncbi:tRNA-splicing ligase [Candidatus Tenderia electrophaga]|jgi:tRNA-splicing ligase RtcB|uniref:tRNA-splicing ligase RtcB n=1 Tax=Candidatus Tenderia electrophaga TaxID=1748243 RepID=A0A0S2T9U4_9GAMM|nr:tRNA-splicing ligase [Candidatus Tenderia electrophaga]
MDISELIKCNDYCWEIPAQGKMRVPAVIYADETLLQAMDEKVAQQISNVAKLPGIVQAAYAMPDAHWGYGFPIGGVAAFDAEDGGVVSAGGVGFDISCGVRTLLTGLKKQELMAKQTALADMLFYQIPAGVGSTGCVHLNHQEMDAMLQGGARWAVRRGFGLESDLERIEEQGCMAGADASQVSEQAKKRQKDEMGTLGSGNHYLEVQCVSRIFDQRAAAAFGLQEGDVVVSIHCGSRGLGHQIGTEFLKRMVLEAGRHGIELPDRELACAPVNSATGQAYLGAMRAGINCALANRQILTHLTRKVFAEILPQAELRLLYDVSHNTCKVETHEVEGRKRKLFVHRKGATRAFGPGHPAVPGDLRSVGQPVIIGGSMGTASYILAGTAGSEQLAYSSACHGAGRAMSRHAATKRWRGREVMDVLAGRGIMIRSPSQRGVAEEAPGAYKDVAAVVEAADAGGLATTVARLEPLVCVKG